MHCRHTQTLQPSAATNPASPVELQCLVHTLALRVPVVAGEWLMLSTGKGCRHSARVVRHIGRWASPPPKWLPPPCPVWPVRSSATALPPSFGRWADAPPLRCGLSTSNDSEPVRYPGPSMFFFSLLAPQAPLPSRALKVILCSASSP